jgi:hypothetical protein
MPSKWKIATVVQAEDGSYHLVQRTPTKEDAYSSAVFMAVRAAVRGDSLPLVRILFSGRPLDAQERGCIQDYLDGKFKLARGRQINLIVMAAANEVRRRKRERRTKHNVVVDSVAEDFGVDSAALNNYLNRSKKPPRKKSPR